MILRVGKLELKTVSIYLTDLRFGLLQLNNRKNVFKVSGWLNHSRRCEILNTAYIEFLP